MSILKMIMDKSYSIEDILDYIVADFVYRKNLNKYLNAVNHDYVECLNDEHAYYDYLSKKITYYHNDVDDTLKNYFVNDIFVGNEKWLFDRLYFVFILVHELRHVQQHKILQFGNSHFSDLLFYAFNYPSATDKSKLVSEGYDNNEVEAILNKKRNTNFEYISSWGDFAPFEKEADYYACNFITKLIAPVRKGFSNIDGYFNYELLTSLIRGYEGDIIDLAPYLTYISDRGDEALFSKFDWYDDDVSPCIINVSKKYDLFRRMSLGLPISIKDYDVMTKKLNNNPIYKRYQF